MLLLRTHELDGKPPRLDERAELRTPGCVDLAGQIDSDGGHGVDGWGSGWASGVGRWGIPAPVPSFALAFAFAFAFAFGSRAAPPRGAAREPERERRTFSSLALGRDLAAQETGDVAADREAEAGA